MSFHYPPMIAIAILEREPFYDLQLMGYPTPGGSYIIASPSIVNDDDLDHDIAVIDIHNNVFPLRVTAYIDELKVLLLKGYDYGGES